MKAIVVVSLSLAVMFVVIGIILLANNYYLCKKVVPRIDELIYGHRFPYDTWLTLILRMQAYMAWSTFYEYLPRLAEKRGWTEKAAKIPPKTRRLLILSSLLPFLLVTLGGVGRLMMYLYPELDKSRHEITQQVETPPHPIIRDKPWSGDRPDNSKSQEAGGISSGGFISVSSSKRQFQ